MTELRTGRDGMGCRTGWDGTGWNSHGMGRDGIDIWKLLTGRDGTG